MSKMVLNYACNDKRKHKTYKKAYFKPVFALNIGMYKSSRNSGS